MQWWAASGPGVGRRAHAYLPGNQRSLCRKLRRDQWPPGTVRTHDPATLSSPRCTPCARRADGQPVR